MTILSGALPDPALAPAPTPAELLGPPPFRFSPRGADGGARVSGPAFSRPFRALACAIVGACCLWMARLWQRGAVSPGSGLVWVAAGLALMLWTLACILRSRTTLSSEGLHQRWIWDKAMPLRELAFCRLIRVPGLDWLVAPRLYARTLTGKFAVFHAASPALLDEFRRLVRELDAFRRQR
jgi:hypothetical protein